MSYDNLDYEKWGFCLKREGSFNWSNTLFIALVKLHNIWYLCIIAVSDERDEDDEGEDKEEDEYIEEDVSPGEKVITDTRTMTSDIASAVVHT